MEAVLEDGHRRIGLKDDHAFMYYEPYELMFTGSSVVKSAGWKSRRPQQQMVH